MSVTQFLIVLLVASLYVNFHLDEKYFYAGYDPVILDWVRVIVLLLLKYVVLYVAPVLIVLIQLVKFVNAFPRLVTFLVITLLSFVQFLLLIVVILTDITSLFIGMDVTQILRSPKMVFPILTCAIAAPVFSGVILFLVSFLMPRKTITVTAPSIRVSPPVSQVERVVRKARDSAPEVTDQKKVVNSESDKKDAIKKE